MKRLMVFWVLISLVISGCSVGLNRQGYDVKSIEYQVSYDDCKVAIKKDFILNDYEFELLGEIEAYDKGLTLECCEKYVLSIFLIDACAVGANVINIVEEKQPDWWTSGCYRAKAQLIKIKDEKQAASIKTDYQYFPADVEYRSRLSHQIKGTAINAGIMGGLSGGMMAK